MSRPENITNEDIARWDEIIEHDPIINSLPPNLVDLPIFREVCYAGIWLYEKLAELSCPNEIILRIQDYGGKLSFGRDPWEVHQQILQDYIDNKLVFESNSNGLLN